jgi:3-oxoacyl-[acyl-carrier protein] reductase
VTGAGRGIGRAIATALSADGLAVGLLGRDAAALAETAAGCAGRTVMVPADVTVRAAVEAAVAGVETALGPVDLLVNNAGLVDAAEVPAWAADPDQWWGVVEANLRGPYLTIRSVVPGMLARGGGRILNINSGMGHRPYPHYSAYSVSKGALGRLTDCLAPALEGTGVTILDVSPGLVRTGMTTPMPMWADAKPEQWNPVSNVVNVVRAFARGELDALSGRFVHASKDDISTLLAHAEEMAARDARTLRLRPYGPDDPLG